LSKLLKFKFTPVFASNELWNRRNQLISVGSIFNNWVCSQITTLQNTPRHEIILTRTSTWTTC